MTARPEPEGRWEHWLVHLLWAVSVRTSALGEAALAGTPLTLAGLGMLENINARPGITIAEISRRAPQTQQALSQIAARLEKLGYVERRLAGRGRGVALHLPPAGAAARSRAHLAMGAFLTLIAVAAGADRHTRLVELLEDARATIGELSRTRADGPPRPARRPD